jgi:hypothetical protein
MHAPAKALGESHISNSYVNSYGYGVIFDSYAFLKKCSPVLAHSWRRPFVLGAGELISEVTLHVRIR